MAKDKRTIKDFGNPKKSERKKYLETLMARVGVGSISDIRKEDRKAFIDAARPSKETEKKLIEMGHSINKDNNILSLGRVSSIFNIYKASALSGEAEAVDLEVSKLSSNISKAYGNELEFSLFISYYINENKTKYNPDLFKKEVEKLFKSKSISTDSIKKDLEDLSSLLVQHIDFLVAEEKRIEDEKKKAEIKKIEEEAKTKDTKKDDKDQTKKTEKPRDEVSLRDLDLSSLPSELTNISSASQRVDIQNLKQTTKDYLKILNHVAKQKGKKLVITSAARSSRDQARIMLNNFSEKGGSNYLIRLYGEKVRPIATIYSGSESRDKKIEDAAAIIDRIGMSNHLKGESIDLSLSSSKNDIIDIVKETQQYAEVNILDEGDHIHLDIKSLTPGGKLKRFARLNKYFWR